MTNQLFASVWDAIEDTPAQAEKMRLRSSLMMAISEHVKTNGLNQTQAAHLFGVTQPRISDLMRGKIDLFSIDTLVAMLSSAGLQVEIKVHVAGTRSNKSNRRAKGPRGSGRSAVKPAKRKSAA